MSLPEQQHIFVNPYRGASGLTEMCAATCDARDLAYMCGATWEAACDVASAVLATFKEELPQYFVEPTRRYSRQPKPYVYKPRRDWSKASCRLPEKHWLPLRAQIFRRDGYVCAYCGDSEAKMVIDHIVPISRGGSNDPDNLCVACDPCNSSKNDKLLSEWKGRYIY
jgi:hypothetical protein